MSKCKCLMCKEKIESGVVVTDLGDTLCMDCYMKFLEYNQTAKLMMKYNPRFDK